MSLSPCELLFLSKIAYTICVTLPTFACTRTEKYFGSKVVLSIESIFLGKVRNSFPYIGIKIVCQSCCQLDFSLKFFTQLSTCSFLFFISSTSTRGNPNNPLIESEKSHGSTLSELDHTVKISVK